MTFSTLFSSKRSVRRNALIALTAAMSLVGTADARDYFGIRFGFPEVGLSLGSTSLISRNIGGRLTVDFGYYSNAAVLGGDLMYILPIDPPGRGLSFELYFGGGLGFALGRSSGFDNIHGLVGANVQINRDLGVFAELRPFGYGNAYYGGYYYGGSLGLNFTL
jgi:hypothetical protein